MKKEIKFFSLAILLILGLLTFAIADNASLENDSDGVVCAQDVKECSDGSYVSRNPDNNCEFFACSNEENEELLGSSCGTVAPGYQEECCINKGYAGWNAEEFKCIGEEQENKQNKVGTTYSGKGLTQSQIQNITQSRNRIRAYYGNSSECPQGCACSGSTIKCQFENGTRTMTVYAGNSGNVIVQVKNVNASTNVILYKNEEGKVYGVFRNNETKEIILPDEAFEKVRERNQKRLQLEDESISLTEEGYYQIQTKKKARLFLLVPVREQVKAQVNAETGEIIRIRNPWWGFLARDNRE